MQEFKYQLEKADYMDWIHWNVERQDMKKMKMFSILIYAGFFVFYVGLGIKSGKGIAAVASSTVTMIVLGGVMFYMISKHNRERMIWKRSGLKKLEKTTGFPNIVLTIRENGITMEVPDQAKNEFSFIDVTELEETPRLFLIGTADGKWQFVAKSAFADQEAREQFKALMNEKIEDAKENPEKYQKAEPEEISEATGAEFAEYENQNSASGLGEDEPVIEPVDTSSMGKIGKMAHIMAALAADETDEEETEKKDGADIEEDMDGNSDSRED